MEQKRAGSGSTRLVSLQHQVARSVEVAEALRHLLPFYQQKAHVHPVVRERLARRSFRLRDFVLVMRKDQVLAAEMDVERIAQILHRHGRALDVPARTTG